MSQISSWPVTITVVPTRRRHASRTVREGLGEELVQHRLEAPLYSPSSLWKRSSSPWRSTGSSTVVLGLRTSASSCLSAPDRSAIRARNRSVCPLSSSSLRARQPLFLPVDCCTIGVSRLTSRACRLPNNFATNP